MNHDENQSANENQKIELPKSLRIDENAWCLIIAFIQVGGGLVGIGLFAYHFGALQSSFLLTLVVAPFFYGIYSGYLLWQGKVKGLNHSLIVQAIQIPMFSFAYVGYNLQIGIVLSIGWFNSKGAFNLHFGSASLISINPSSDTYGVGINLIALAALYYLWTFKKKLELYHQKRQKYPAEI